MKLIDVYPGAPARELGPRAATSSWCPTRSSGRGTASASRSPSRSPPDTVLEYTLDSLHTQNYAFRKGHRIMVQVQSTLVPADRPQPADLRPQHLRGEGVRLQGGDPAHLPLAKAPSSHVSIPVVVGAKSSRVGRRLAVALLCLAAVTAVAGIRLSPRSPPKRRSLRRCTFSSSGTASPTRTICRRCSRALAAAAGRPRPFVRAVTAPGLSLQDQWDLGEAQKAIAVGGWDFVVLQQGPSASPEGTLLLRTYSEALHRAHPRRGRAAGAVHGLAVDLALAGLRRRGPVLRATRRATSAGPSLPGRG